MAMPATAAASAASAAQFLLCWHPSQFKRLADVFLDGLLDLVQFLLRVQESARHRVLHQRIAMLLEVRNLLARQGQGHLLLLLQRLAFGHEPVVMCAGLFVPQQGIDPLADRAHGGLLQNRLAELSWLLQDRRLFNRRLHSHDRFSQRAQASLPFGASALQYTTAAMKNPVVDVEKLMFIVKPRLSLSRLQLMDTGRLCALSRSVAMRFEGVIVLITNPNQGLSG